MTATEALTEKALAGLAMAKAALEEIVILSKLGPGPTEAEMMTATDIIDHALEATIGVNAAIYDIQYGLVTD